MIFISNGIQKSASSFAFLLVNEVANLISPRYPITQQLPEHLRAMYFEDISELIDELVATVPQNAVYAIKTHTPLNSKIKAHLEQGNAMAAIAYRDPYDIVVSLLDAGTRERQKPLEQQRKGFTDIRTVEDALQRIPGFLANGRTWLEQVKHIPAIMRTPYEGLRNYPKLIVDEYAQRLGVRVNARAIANRFLQNTDKIWEYNKGQSGRGRALLNLPDKHPIKILMDEFNADFPQP